MKLDLLSLKKRKKEGLVAAILVVGEEPQLGLLLLLLVEVFLHLHVKQRDVVLI